MLGKRLKELWKKEGIYQKQLAEVLGVSQPLIGFWEAESRLPSLADVRKLENYFGITDNELTYIALHDRLGDDYNDFVENMNVAQKINYPSEVQEIIVAVQTADLDTQKKVLATMEAALPVIFKS